MTVQEEIAWQISEALRLKLTTAQKKQAAQAIDGQSRGVPGLPARTSSLEQLDAGRFPPRARANSSAPSTSIPLYARGVRRPRRHATARWRTTATSTRAAGFPQARAAAERALQLDPDLPDAHVTLALGHLFGEWDWPAAERELQQALALNPKHAAARTRSTRSTSRPAGRFDESLTEARTARDLDPLSLFNNIGVAWAHHFAGRHREAIHEALRVRDLVPGTRRSRQRPDRPRTSCSGASRTPRA